MLKPSVGEVHREVACLPPCEDQSVGRSHQHVVEQELVQTVVIVSVKKRLVIANEFEDLQLDRAKNIGHQCAIPLGDARVRATVDGIHECHKVLGIGKTF